MSHAFKQCGVTNQNSSYFNIFVTRREFYVAQEQHYVVTVTQVDDQYTYSRTQPYRTRNVTNARCIEHGI